MGISAVAADRPNILICVADDWGWPHAGVYGDAVVKTPVFDRLAGEGVVFSHAFVSSPSCTPSRNSILTGQEFYRLGEGANLWSTLEVRHPNFLSLLEASGYEIAHYRKAWGPGKFAEGGYERHPMGPWKGPERFLKEWDRTGPFCYWFGSHDPHRPYESGSGVAGGIDLEAIDVPDFLPDVAEVRSDLADYYGEVERWDREVGEMIERLRAEGVLENTIVIVTSDNGMPFPRAKSNLYDYGTRVPLVIWWGDDIHTRVRSESLVSLIDLAPTLLDAAGLVIPGQMTGQSLLPLLKGNAWPEERGFIVTGRERHNISQMPPSLAGYPSRAIRTGQWLLILNLEPDRWPMGVPGGAMLPSGHTWDQGRFLDAGSSPTKDVLMESFNDYEGRTLWNLAFGKRPEVELYHVTEDPFQLHNLAGLPENKERVERLRRQLVEYLRETGDPRFTDAEVVFDTAPYRWP
jgi:arylsulfatase A-like enzyme